MDYNPLRQKSFLQLGLLGLPFLFFFFFCFLFKFFRQVTLTLTLHYGLIAVLTKYCSDVIPVELKPCIDEEPAEVSR